MTSDSEGKAGRSGLIARRRVQWDGKRVNLSLEDEFWEALLEIAAARRLTPGQLLSLAIAETPSVNRSSAVRIFVLTHFRRAAAAKGAGVG